MNVVGPSTVAKQDTPREITKRTVLPRIFFGTTERRSRKERLIEMKAAAELYNYWM